MQFITNDPATQTMAYNGANELTSSVVGAITTTYTYDDWGRTISKADGTHSARYIWFAGDKLKQYESDFPSEADVAFQYDGLGKRRLKLVNISAPSDADYTWYRWDAGWNMIGEYAAGTDAGTTWDVGALERWYQGKAAHADGDPDTAAHNYNLRDHIGTVRTVYSQSQTLLARFEALPFGTSNFSTGLGLNFGFSGMQWDQELLAYFTPFRYMEPANPRWLSKDPIGMVDGPNLYNYVGGAPVNRIDTLGLDWTLWDFANWFFNGEGQPVDFSNIGLLDDYRADDQVVSSVAILKIRLTMRARTLAQQLLASCDGPGTKSGAVSYGTFFHLEFSLSMGALGVLGHHILFGSGRCRVTVDCCTKAVTRKCSANFSVNDMYTRPLGPIINDVGGTPYELHINWSEDF
jgi:RHS repeat-associated protein